MYATLEELMAREFGGQPEDYWVFGPDDPDDPLRKLLEDEQDRKKGPALPF
jgi:hypothetical protein